MSYNDRNHWSVITQLYGSTWPATIPYCVANMIITLLVFYFFRDRTFSSTGTCFNTATGLNVDCYQLQLYPNLTMTFVD